MTYKFGSARMGTESHAYGMHGVLSLFFLCVYVLYMCVCVCVCTAFFGLIFDYF